MKQYPLYPYITNLGGWVVGRFGWVTIVEINYGKKHKIEIKRDDIYWDMMRANILEITHSAIITQPKGDY